MAESDYTFPIEDIDRAKGFIENLDYLKYPTFNNLQRWFSQKLLDNEEFLLFLEEKRMSQVMEFASDRLKKDRNFVLKMIKRNAYQVDYIDERLKDDWEIMALACKKASDVFIVASKRLKNDKEFIKEVVRDNFLILEHVDEKLLDDKNFVMELVGINGSNLSYASERLRDDYDVVLWALKHGTKRQIIDYASDRINANPKMQEYVSSDNQSLALEIQIDELKTEMKKREEQFQSTLEAILNKLNELNSNSRG